MNHKRNLIRLLIIVFWLTLVGIFYEITTNYNNVFTLGWSTLLFYAVISIVVVYVGYFLSKHFWSKE